MITYSHPKLSITKQCELASISRSTFYYSTAEECDYNLNLMHIIDKQHTKHPYYGSRQMTAFLRREGYIISRKKVQRLMKVMGLAVIYRKPNTSKKSPEYKVYPYLLKDINITEPNKVWCSDITYIPMRKGFMYLVAIMDWFSRKVLSWKISNCLETQFCLDAVEEAISLFGTPEIFNTDQGSQFTSHDFTNLLSSAGITISMDGKRRWVDNVMIERFWRTIKYEYIYLNEFKDGNELKQGVQQWIKNYNTQRPHSSLGGQTPHEMYNFNKDKKKFWQGLFNNRIAS